MVIIHLFLESIDKTESRIYDKVSIDTFLETDDLAVETKVRIESELEVKAYLQDLKFALNHGAQINF